MIEPPRYLLRCTSRKWHFADVGALPNVRSCTNTRNSGGIGHKLASWVREKMRDVRLRIGSVGQTIMTEQSNYWNSHLGKIALALLAVALVAILGIYESIPVKQRYAAVAAAAPDPTAQAIRDLQTSQQQAIDQLKGLQQTVSAGQVETRRLSEEVTGLTRKLEALQQSFASAQRAPAPVSTENLSSGVVVVESAKDGV